MNKSIEAIWKEGFMQDDALVAPKLNNLYKQKSANIIDKMIRMFKINLRAIQVFAAVLLIVSFFNGVPYLGAALSLLLAALVVVGNKELDKLEKIDKAVSSYQYLKGFDGWLKDTISTYTRIYRIWYPSFFLTFIVGIWFSDFGKSLQNEIIPNSPEIYLLHGIPVYWLLGILAFAALLGFFAGAIYKFDMNIVYGRVFTKLDEIITDMEELRN